MAVLQAIGTALVIALLIGVVVELILDWKDMPHYARVYRTLSQRQFTWYKDHLSSPVGHNQVIYFADMGHVKLKEGTYLHAGFPFQLNFYAWFWRRRFVRYFKRHYGVPPEDKTPVLLPIPFAQPIMTDDQLSVLVKQCEGLSPSSEAVLPADDVIELVRTIRTQRAMIEAAQQLCRAIYQGGHNTPEMAASDIGDLLGLHLND